MPETAYKSGLSTAIHDKADVQDYFALVYEAVQRHRDGLKADLFSGGGRDIAVLWERLNGDGQFVAVDADPRRIIDMLAKNDSGTVPKFSTVYNEADLSAAFSRHEIAVLQGSFPEDPVGDAALSLKGRINFALCNAGIMFVTSEDLKKTLALFADILAPKGEMFLRFSLERADQSANPNYHVHDPVLVKTLLQNQGLKVTRKPDLPDPLSRPFAWVDLHVCKPG